MHGSCVRVASVGQINILYIFIHLDKLFEKLIVQYIEQEIDIKAKVDYSNNFGVWNVIEDSGWIL